MKQKVFKALCYLHQLPQNLLGILAIKFSQASFNGQYYWTKYRFGVSLGRYIIMDNADELKHEQGHQKQSLYLGWLYLLIIGLPSVLGNLYARILHKNSKWYYSQPWEKWADSLGRVKRSFYFKN